MRISGNYMRALILTMMVMVILPVIGGCGVKGERLMSLASFKQIQASARGPIFMSMVRAYYDQSPAEDLIDQETLASFNKRLEVGEVTADDRKALMALLSIQAVDESKPIPSDEVLQSIPNSQIWNQVSMRSKRAFLSIYH